MVRYSPGPRPLFNGKLTARYLANAEQTPRAQVPKSKKQRGVQVVEFPAHP